MVSSDGEVEKPIFVLGAPGSGTTLLYETLCNHRDLAYVTFNILRAGVHRHSPTLASALYRIHNFIHRDAESARPHEANPFWFKYFGSYEYVTEDDYTPIMAEYYRRNVSMVQKLQRSPRFVNKNMQNCVRVRLLDRIFPTAKFVHIIRDGRAVAYSIFTKHQKVIVPTVFLSNLEKLLGTKHHPDRSKIFNIGLGWSELVTRAREASAFGFNRYCEVRYEDLISNPNAEFKRIVEFCGLDWYEGFEERIPKTTDMNFKWKSSDDEQLKDLEESTAYVRRILGIK